jgi:hypothetical protein
MFEPLHEHSKGHWNRYSPHSEVSSDGFRTIHGLLYTALKALIDMDPDLYNKCEQEYDQSCLNRQHEFDERRHKWELIERQARKSEDHPLEDHQSTNHIDEDNNENSTSTQEMQIDLNTLINVPEQIPEEPEHDDTSMSVDHGALSPPVA